MYRTASIGKAITATAAMQLAERGVLDLDAKVQKYCPAFPEKPWPITARALLSHTSGIRHYEGPNVQAELFITRHYDRISDALEIFANDDLVQQPGADYHYSTWGYVVLGCVLEGAAGKDYTALIQEEVFDRAGMSKTRADDPRAIVPHRARGYVREHGELQSSRAVDMSAKLPAGGWITTASDLVRFMNALMDGRLVRKETLAEMLTPFVLPDGGGTVDGYGLGLALSEHRGMRVGRHGGGTPQVSAFIQFVPEKRLAVAFMFNLEEVAGSKRGEIADAITDILHDASEGRD